MSETHGKTRITIRGDFAVPPLKATTNVKLQKRTRNRFFDGRSKRILPYLNLARSQRLRKLNDLFEFILPRFRADFPHRSLSRSSLRRMIIHLDDLGLADGLDDRSTARKLGRPTKGSRSLVAPPNTTTDQVDPG